MTRHLAPGDAEYLLRAAQRLRELGRAESEFPLVAKAVEIEPSLHVLKTAFQAAIRAQKFSSAVRFLVQLEANFEDSETDFKWLMEAMNKIASHEQIGEHFIARPRDAELTAQLGISNDERVVGLIGPFSAYENIDVVFDACNELVQNDEKLKLLMISEGEPLAAALATNRPQHRTYRAPWLIQAKWLPHDQVADYYALLDTVVIPHKHLTLQKLIPYMKAAEAMAYGKRLVVPDVAPLAKYAEKYESVVTYGADKASILAQVLQRSLKLPAPKPNIELLLSAHAEPKVRPLREEGSDTAQKSVSEPQSKLTDQVTNILENSKIHFNSKQGNNKNGTDAAVSCDLKKFKTSYDYKVAIIADEFTSNSFSGEFQALPIEPDNWLDVFQDNQPDIFFCESAWAGPNLSKRHWKGKIYASINFPNENRKVLLSILEYCNKSGIPTVFWNKEDPTHHDDRIHDFVKTASLFDYIFTTAEECVDSYKYNYGVKNVFPLTFGTNPRLFNPVEIVKRNDHVVFAGSWYENHTERCNKMKHILDNLIDSGFKLDIHNRYHGDSDPLHIWPEKYTPYLLPAKPHHEMPEVYKSSIYGLNFNTVTSSSTMFARRIFELMSSNTLVISNYAKGVDEMFGDLVIFSDHDPERLSSLTKDEADRIRHKALHEVLEKHTYKQRWRSILQSIGMPYVKNDITLTFTYLVRGKEEALSAISWYQQYGMQFEGSCLLIVVDKSVDPLDVAKFYQEFNRFGVSVTSMLHAEKYAITDRYRPVETTHFVALRPGQSVDIVRIKESLLHLQYMTEQLITFEERPGQRYRKALASANAEVIGSASQFADWLKHQTKKQSFTAYWV